MKMLHHHAASQKKDFSCGLQSFFIPAVELYVGFKYNLDNAGAKPCKRVTREDRSRQNIESDSTVQKQGLLGRCTAVSVYIFQNIMRIPSSSRFCSLLLALCWLGGSLPMDPLWQSPRRGTEAFSPFSRLPSRWSSCWLPATLWQLRLRFIGHSSGWLPWPQLRQEPSLSPSLSPWLPLG